MPAARRLAHTSAAPLRGLSAGASITEAAVNVLISPILSARSHRFGRGRARAPLQPAHHPAQALADLLDQQRALLRAQAAEVAAARLILGDPFARETAVLHARQDALHRLPRRLADDARTLRQVAIFGGIRNRVAHARQPALVNEVHDQLHFMQALEVRDLGLVAGAY